MFDNNSGNNGGNDDDQQYYGVYKTGAELNTDPEKVYDSYEEAVAKRDEWNDRYNVVDFEVRQISKQMYDKNNDSDDDSTETTTETETTYVVYDDDGNIEGEFDTHEEAHDELRYLQYRHGDFFTIEEEEVEVEVEQESDDEGEIALAEYPELSTTAYSFIRGPDPTPEDDVNPFDVQKWGLGNHTRGMNLQMDELDRAIEQTEGLDDDFTTLLRSVKSRVEQTSVRDFECNVCGLNHGHSDDKHDIRDAFDVLPRFADEMQFSPYCHCGVNELAMLLDYYGFYAEEMPVFSDGDQFEGALDLDPRVLRKAVQTAREEDVTIRELRKSYPIGRAIEEDVVDDLTRFFNRYTNVKNAANNAPIADETRHEIEDIRKAVEETVSEQ